MVLAALPWFGPSIALPSMSAIDWETGQRIRGAPTSWTGYVAFFTFLPRKLRQA